MSRVFLVLAVLWVPCAVYAAAVDRVGFTTDTQSISPATASAQITIETQDTSGVAVNGNSVCIQVTSSSATGEFSTNETSWNSTPIRTLALTQSTSQYRRNFYYRDSASGSFILTVKAGLRPGSTCTEWDATSAIWSAIQTIQVGSSSGNQNSQTQQTSTTTSPSSTSSNLVMVPSYVAPPTAELFADGGENRTVIVGADAEFRGRAYNRDQEIVDNVRFHWNFGDGTTAEGVAVSHHFAYPGTYAVILTIAQHISAASDRILVTAESAELDFVIHPDASAALTNEAGRDIDISRWLISSFGRTFVFPEGTEILKGQTLRIPHAILGFTVGPQTELQYPNGVRVGLLSDAPLVAGSAPLPAVPTVPTPTSIRTPAPRVADIVEEKGELEDDIDIVSTSSVAAVATVSKGTYLWWLTPIAFAALASAAVFTIRRARKGEWNIIDES